LAAVAVLLREDEARGTEVLFIRRAEHPLDPWSGHMAFPGGRHDPEDGSDLRVTAERETREELGLSLLEHAELIGRLPQLPAVSRTHHVDMIIAPFVYELRGSPRLTPNEEEVAEALWAPLSPNASGAVLTTYSFVYKDRPIELPGHRVGEHVVWGLTFQMLQSLLDRLAG
jgi:8-oxo-dGTP pyrophosphatase MutT (NUDIX family)